MAYGLTHNVSSRGLLARRPMACRITSVIDAPAGLHTYSMAIPTLRAHQLRLDVDVQLIVLISLGRLHID